MHAGDTERQMDFLRHFKHAQTLRLLAQDLAGELPLETLSDHLSDLADLVLRGSAAPHLESCARAHREHPRFADRRLTASSAARNSATPPTST